MQVNITLIDDDAMSKEGKEHHLRHFSKKNEWEFITRDSVEELDVLLGSIKIDILLIRLGLFWLNSTEIIEKIRKAEYFIKIIIYGIPENFNISYLIKEGINGCLLINAPFEELAEVILNVKKEGFYMSKSLSENNFQRNRGINYETGNDIVFSIPAMEVLKGICKGMSSIEIADKTGLNIHSVNKHRSEIYNKTGTHNSAGLINYAKSIGLVP